MPGPIERGLLKKRILEEEKRKALEEQQISEQENQNKPGIFSKLRSMFVVGDPAIRGAARTSEEALRREEEARKKKEELRKKKGY